MKKKIDEETPDGDEYKILYNAKLNQSEFDHSYSSSSGDEKSPSDIKNDS